MRDQSNPNNVQSAFNDDFNRAAQLRAPSSCSTTLRPAPFRVVARAPTVKSGFELEGGEARLVPFAGRAASGAEAADGHDISPAAEWLLDNFHLIEAQLEEIHEGLPQRYFRALPVLIDEPLAGLPRVYSVAWAFVAHTDGDFDEDLLIQFLSAYQETRELNLGEMWALPTTLRVVLIDHAAKIGVTLGLGKLRLRRREQL